LPALVFLVYPVGTLSSAVAGRVVGRFSRRAVVPVGCLVACVGVLITLPDSLPAVVLGLAVMTAGFFAVHGVVSGWVPVRAAAGGVPAGVSGHAWTLGAVPR
jgi:YNFM family putative membrane transporter